MGAGEPGGVMTERGTQGTLIMIAAYVLVAIAVLGVTWMRTGRADQAITIVVTALLVVLPLVSVVCLFVMPDRRPLIFIGGFWAFFVLPFVCVLLWVGPQAWISASKSASPASEPVSSCRNGSPSESAAKASP